jgi:hypothetical protein
MLRPTARPGGAFRVTPFNFARIFLVFAQLLDIVTDSCYDGTGWTADEK